MSLKICIHCLAGTCKVGQDTSANLSSDSINFVITDKTMHLAKEIMPLSKQEASELYVLCSVDKNKIVKRLSVKFDEPGINQYQNEPVSPRSPSPLNSPTNRKSNSRRSSLSFTESPVNNMSAQVNE